jgi:hypothetical protein
MKKHVKDNSFFIAIAVAVTLLLWAISGKGMPPTPRDARHILAQLNSDCTACHGEGQDAAVRSTHPPGVDECIFCHRGRNCHP